MTIYLTLRHYPLISILLLPFLLMLLLPSTHSFPDPTCTSSYCPVELATPGCILCSTNSSLCTSAYRNTSGTYCGQESKTAPGRSIYYWAACCPVSYPCSSVSWKEDQKGVVWDVSGYWCQSDSAPSTSSSDSTALWWPWLVAGIGASLLFWVIMKVKRKWWSDAINRQRQRDDMGNELLADDSHDSVSRHSGVYYGPTLAELPPRS